MGPILNTLAPVFLVIALGAILARTRFLSPELTGGFNRLAYWVGLPCLLFKEIAEAPRLSAQAVTVVAIVLAGMAGCIAAGYLLSRLLRLPPSRVGSFVQAGYRGNLAYVGLAVVFYGFSATATAPNGAAEARQAAVLALGALVPVYNVVAVIVLLARGGPMRPAQLRRMLLRIATNPLLLGCVAGLAFSVAGPDLPRAAGNTLGVIGQTALPLALLAAGGTMARTHLGSEVGLAALAAVVKVGLAPAIGYGVARALGAGGQETAIGMILLACPTAIVAYVMADQLEGDGPLTAQAIVISTLLSVVSLAVAVAMI